MIYCGIDPGLSGAIALYSSQGGILTVVDVPVTAAPERKVLRYAMLAEMLYGIKIERGVIEEVHAMPGQGVTSMFRFGEAYGALTMMLASHSRTLVRVPPRKWKQAFNLGGLDKEAAVRYACDLFPSEASRYLIRKKDHNRAEAMLLAYYAAVFA